MGWVKIKHREGSQLWQGRVRWGWQAMLWGKRWYTIINKGGREKRKEGKWRSRQGNGQRAKRIDRAEVVKRGQGWSRFMRMCWRGGDSPKRKNKEKVRCKNSTKKKKWTKRGWRETGRDRVIKWNLGTTKHSHSNNFSVRLSQLHRLSEHYPKVLLTTCPGSNYCLVLRIWLNFYLQSKWYSLYGYLT